MDSARFPEPAEAPDSAGAGDAPSAGGAPAAAGAPGEAPADTDAVLRALAQVRSAPPVGPAPDGGPGRPLRKAPVPVKIVIAGGFGVGKTTTVAAISEIEPLTTEAEMTSVAAGVDDPGPTGKTTTTVAMDFGCVTIDEALKLYLFGAPGQARFDFMWDDLARGALGALVVVDATRLDDGFAAVDYFERAELPFAVGVNAFYGQLAYDLDNIRWALALSDEVPVVAFDARDRLSVRDAVLVVLNRALDRALRSQVPME